MLSTTSTRIVATQSSVYYHTGRFFRRQTCAQSHNNERKGLRKLSLPPPTWSIHELKLATTQNEDTSSKLISDKEFHLLAYRCLIDTRLFTKEHNAKLKQSLENMMSCISLVTDYLSNFEGSESMSKTDVKQDSYIYDVPRFGMNVETNTARFQQGRNIGSESKDWVERDRIEAERVVDYIRKDSCTKMVQLVDDGQWYFSIQASEAPDEVKKGYKT